MNDFRPQQARELRKLMARGPTGFSRGTAEAFLLKFVFLEAVIRLVGRYYRERSVTPKKKVDQDTSLNVLTVKRSLLYFGVAVDERRVESVLSSVKARRGQKTARMLRNGLVHRWDAGDAAEVHSRFEEIDTAIEGIFQTIRNRVVQSVRHKV